MEALTFKQNEIMDIAARLISEAPSRVWALYGEMGAGKTTLIKAVVEILNSEDVSASPTFGLVHEYLGKDGNPLAYHFDFYRLETPEEVFDMGFEEYLDKDAWIFMEWPERIEPYLPKDCWSLLIETVDDATRTIRERPFKEKGAQS